MAGQDKNDATGEPPARTGISGLDDVLCGGFPRNRLYLVQGDPGVGKTTLALQFLIEGMRREERCFYITLSETREELFAVARGHRFNIEALHIYEMSAAETVSMRNEEENTLYVPAEVELGERMRDLLAEVDRVRPQRVVIDSCSELRLLAQNPLRFRRQLLALKSDLVRRGCTILLLENPTSVGGDPLLQSLVHGVIEMQQLAPLYGAARRRLRVTKLRERDFRGGFHDMIIERGGVKVFPRLVAAEHHEDFERGICTSGIAELDALLGGGMERATSVLIMGPAGSGKSAISHQYAIAAAQRGEMPSIYTFDEGVATAFMRAETLGIDLEQHVHAGRIRMRQVDPAELSPGEFVQAVRDDVEFHNSKIIIIDSLNGYLQAMPEEHFLVAQLHELLSFLRQRGVLTIFVVAQHGFFGPMNGPVDVSYLADTVVLTRFFEAEGRVRKAISVVKKRTGAHEDTIRELSLSRGGVRVGPPLAGFHGVMTGTPEFDGDHDDLVGEKP